MTTAADIKQQVLSRCGMEYSAASQDSEWLSMISSSAAELYELLIAHKDLGYYETETTVTVDPGSRVIPYPSDFKELLSVHFTNGGNGREPVYRSAEGSHNGSSRSYRLTSEGIRLHPSEQAAGDYTFSYIPRFQPLTSLDDTLSDDLDINHWSEYVVTDCAIKFLTKQETDASVYIGQKAALLDRINRSAGGREAAEPFRLWSSQLHDCGSLYDGSPRRVW